MIFSSREVDVAHYWVVVIALLMSAASISAQSPQPDQASREGPAWFTTRPVRIPADTLSFSHPGVRLSPSAGILRAPADSQPHDYRREGFAIGGASFGLAGLWLGVEFCRWSHYAAGRCVVPTAELTIGGAILGAGLGALIGGLIPK